MVEEGVHRGGTLGALVLRACQRYRDESAVVGPDLRLTYAQLSNRISGMMQAFDEVGLERGDGVALLSGNSADVVVATCAVMAAGLRLTALSPLGSEQDHLFCVKDAEVSAIIVDPRFVPRALDLRQGAPKLREVFALGEASNAIDLSRKASAGRQMAEDRAYTDDIAMIAYTGGTTGRPKGVVHTHASALAALHMAASEWEWPTNGKVLAVTPVSHAAGILAYPTFLRGGEFHVLAGFSARSFYDYVANAKIGATFMAPTMIYRLLDDPPRAGDDLRTLETIFYGAAPMDADRMLEAIGCFGSIFMQLYGQTEAPTCITYMRRFEHDVTRLDVLASAGIPQAGLDIVLLDGDGVPVPVGAPGEVCVRGPFVMRGYWNRPTETAEALRGGWLHTGDVGRFDEDGRLHIVDRLKDLIISGGFNIYPREVEDALSGIDGVQACAVVGVPDSKWGEAVAAAVVIAPGADLSSESLINSVKDAKGPIHAPKQVIFVDTLPLTPVGKVDKKALRLLLGADRGG